MPPPPFPGPFPEDGRFLVPPPFWPHDWPRTPPHWPSSISRHIPGPSGAHCLLSCHMPQVRGGPGKGIPLHRIARGKFSGSPETFHVILKLFKFILKNFRVILKNFRVILRTYQVKLETFHIIAKSGWQNTRALPEKEYLFQQLSPGPRPKGDGKWEC
jgi:hypothetical protein